MVLWCDYAEASPGGRQGVLGVALALCCTRENKISHFNAAAKDSLCHLLSGELNIFPPAKFCIPCGDSKQ